MFQLLITSVYELPLAVPNHRIIIDDFTIFKLDHIYVDCFLAASIFCTSLWLGFVLNYCFPKFNYYYYCKCRRPTPQSGRAFCKHTVVGEHFTFFYRDFWTYPWAFTKVHQQDSSCGTQIYLDKNISLSRDFSIKNDSPFPMGLGSQWNFGKEHALAASPEVKKILLGRMASFHARCNRWGVDYRQDNNLPLFLVDNQYSYLWCYIYQEPLEVKNSSCG